MARLERASSKTLVEIAITAPAEKPSMMQKSILKDERPPSPNENVPRLQAVSFPDVDFSGPLTSDLINFFNFLISFDP